MNNFNYKLVTEDELRHRTDWHVIELDYNIDVNKIQYWYDTIASKYNHLKFNLSLTELLNTEAYDVANMKDFIKGEISHWAISWPVSKDIPIPPKFLCNVLLYPEILDDDFDIKCHTLEQYRFGYLLELEEVFGVRFLTEAAIMYHGPGSSISKHIDSLHDIRIHIPIYTNDDAWFLYGEDLSIKYNLKVGKIYLINAGVSHGTINNGSSNRIHILSTPESIDKLLHDF